MTGETRAQRLARRRDEREARLASPGSTQFLRRWSNGQLVDEGQEQTDDEAAS